MTVDDLASQETRPSTAMILILNISTLVSEGLIFVYLKLQTLFLRNSFLFYLFFFFQWLKSFLAKKFWCLWRTFVPFSCVVMAIGKLKWKKKIETKKGYAWFYKFVTLFVTLFQEWGIFLNEVWSGIPWVDYFIINVYNMGMWGENYGMMW